MRKPVTPTHLDPIRHEAWLNEEQVNRQMRELRASCPVSWYERAPYRPFWLVTRHADIKEVMGQNALFINEPRLVLVDTAVEEATEQAYGGRRYAVRTVLDMDGDEHRSYRELTRAWFMGPGVVKLQQRIDALVDRYIATMREAGGQIDFAQEVASQLPLRVILSILGLPESEAPFILRITQQLLSSADPELQRSREGGADVMPEVAAYFGQLLAQRRADPQDDLASVIANSLVGDEAIGALEAISYYLLVSTAGHETTAASIAGGMLAFIQNPEQLQKVQGKPALLRNGANEIVRWVSPIRHFMRTATEDYTLSGADIRAGDSLCVLLPSGNRDEAAFDAPDRFDIERPSEGHVGFGWGAHACLGRQVALAEIRTLFARLLPQLASVELAGTPRPIQSNFTGGYKSLPIRYRFRDA
ncbi:cytochrome P450 [Craterilacuibacter sp. RT1T]|uniref:cytochrome P450 n=1 Tax=Craterilacuibacter sp. RT1T TaxID=2942211 RepID=UPI0020BF114D|nr:cytochrome P450 [Craterilacuibacter sp. RT1T]MCL6262689.1 cytochrome P450 [Craterilacuibacter sp. RT1T]